MAEGCSYKTPRQRHIAFRAMVADVFDALTKDEAEFLALVYEETRSYSKYIELADMLMKQEYIRNCVSDLTLLGENFVKAKRSDLKKKVDEYIQQHKPQQDHPECPALALVQARVTSTKDWAMDENYDPEKATLSAIGYKELRGKKRRRLTTPEEKDLDEARGVDAIMLQECDSTSDNSDADGSGTGGDTTPEDKKFMKLAQEAAKNSKDDQTKVGAVVVDTKNGTVLGTGWNRMPKGCEEKFNWDTNVPIEDGKHFYVVYAIRAAIFDAFEKKADLAGSVLYTTLYPSNTCAQCIRDAGIREVVYTSDKFHHMNFMKAARRILDGIKCRQYDEKD